MDLSKIRPSFSDLSEQDQLQLIRSIRERRQYTPQAVSRRQTRASKSPTTPKHIKGAVKSLDNITPEQALQMLAMLGELNEET